MLKLKISQLTESAAFNQLIFLFIITATILVGIESYESLQGHLAVAVLEWLVLIVFTLEVGVKVLAEGAKPWRYFTGPDCRWNNFDFAIVLASFSLIWANESESLGFLRVMRLVRVAKLFKQVPALQLITMGLLEGMKSISYIILLLMLIFYLFAVVAVFLFRGNDPGHFGDLAITFVTLFRCSTLDDWTDVMYINMFGCDTFGAGVYFQSDSEIRFSTYFGSYFEYTCHMPKAQWMVSALFFVAFTILTSFLVLSLFIGTITLSMSELLQEQQRARKQARIAAVVSPEWLWDTVEEALGEKQIMTDDFKKRRSSTFHQLHQPSMKRPASARGLLERSRSVRIRQGTAVESLGRGYLYVSFWCRRVAGSAKFEALVLSFICLAGVLVGLNTAMEQNFWLALLDHVILGVFTLECLLKLFAEGRKPYRYFTDSWNRFDFALVFIFFMMIARGSADGGSMISVLRLLRILRVLKLVNNFKQLNIIVEALLKGFASITYISLMMLVLFFMFGIVGMILFKENDPWHFGTLQDAMLTLFRIATLEDWTDMMYINMWGCDRFGYGEWLELCTSPFAWGWVAVLYFVVFTVLGSMVLVTLFLGIVTTSMEQASLRQQMEDELQDEIYKAVKKYLITDYGVRLLYNAFTLLDLNDGGSLEYDELKPMLSAVSDDFTEATLKAIFNKVDRDKSGHVDFAEFLHLMVLINEWAVEKDDEKKESFLRRSFSVTATIITGNPRFFAKLFGRAGQIKKINFAKLKRSLRKHFPASIRRRPLHKHLPDSTRRRSQKKFPRPLKHTRTDEQLSIASPRNGDQYPMIEPPLRITPKPAIVGKGKGCRSSRNKYAVDNKDEGSLSCSFLRSNSDSSIDSKKSMNRRRRSTQRKVFVLATPTLQGVGSGQARSSFAELSTNLSTDATVPISGGERMEMTSQRANAIIEEQIDQMWKLLEHLKLQNLALMTELSNHRLQLQTLTEVGTFGAQPAKVQKLSSSSELEKICHHPRSKAFKQSASSVATTRRMKTILNEFEAVPSSRISYNRNSDSAPNFYNLKRDSPLYKEHSFIMPDWNSIEGTSKEEECGTSQQHNIFGNTKKIKVSAPCQQASKLNGTNVSEILYRKEEKDSALHTFSVLSPKSTVYQQHIID